VLEVYHALSLSIFLLFCFNLILFCFRSTTGIPHKSPNEIAMLRGSQPLPTRSNNNSNKKNKFKKSKSGNKEKLITRPPLSNYKKIELPNLTDWGNLNKLTRNIKGEFALASMIGGLNEV